MDQYTKDLEEKNEELSEALEEASTINKELLQKFMEFATTVQRHLSMINSNSYEIYEDIHTEDPAGVVVLSEAILSGATVNDVFEANNANLKLVQGLKDKSHDIHSKLLKMYKEI